MYRLTSLVALGTLLVLTACQSAANTPPEPAPNDAAAFTVSPFALTPPMGLWRLRGDLTTGALELTPLFRDGNAISDTYDVDITVFSAATFGLSGITVPNASTLRITFEWSHPFPTTTTRKDLHVFDVRMHVMPDVVAQTLSGPSGMQAPTGASGALEAVARADVAITNADGWSSWGDEVVEPVTGAQTPTVYPFVLVHRDDGVAALNPDAPVGWNVAPMAATVYSIDLDFDINATTYIDGVLALDGSYGQSATKTTRLAPKYFNPEYNLKEGWLATANVSSPVQIGNPGSNTTLNLTLFDHQGNSTASGAFDPTTAPSTSLRYESKLEEARVSVPGALATTVVVPAASFTGNGAPATPYTAAVVINGATVSGTPGSYTGVVAFIDSFGDNASATTPIPTKGYTRALAIENRYDFATYQTFTLTTIPAGPNQAPVADVAANPTIVYSRGTTQLSPGPGTLDPDGSITLYEYDFNYTGVFTVDASSATPAPQTSPALTNATATPIMRTMAMRVTDNGAPALTGEETIVITINAPTWTQIHGYINSGAPQGGDNCVQCHAMPGHPSGLMMDGNSAATRANLVGVASFTCPPETRVIAGNSTNSFIIKKLLGTAACGGQMPATGLFWSATDIQRFRDWIDAGALNN